MVGSKGKSSRATGSSGRGESAEDAAVGENVTNDSEEEDDSVSGEIILQPPDGISATRFRVDGEEVAVLSFPLPDYDLPESLTDAERQVVALLLDGRTNAAIAEERGTSVRTVANQIASIFRKAGVASRSELVTRLRR